ncbi:histidinol-phosphate transaminase [Arenimonas sp.]|jgi:histidinol-phosphate aminotransferase|uniref:histidinol-phosphate transaminase n=1 Tax=Arenimonas sp. TaxID=1872635 RepID=UPI0037C098FF
MSAVPDFKALANPAIRTLAAYDPGHDIPSLRRRFADAGGLLELGSNENPFGPSPSVLTAINAELDRLHRYPDPSGKALKQAIAQAHGTAMAQIALGNGSHELLMQLGQVFVGPDDEVLLSRYCFAVYPIAAKAAGAKLVFVDAFPADHAMPLGHDLEAMAAAITPRTKLICLANPNNPTGTWCDSSQLSAFLARVPSHVLVLVDEAYIEYVSDPALRSAVELRTRFPNLIVARTFSKAYGLAGLRVGYIIAEPALLALLEPVRESFNVNALALTAAQAALADDAHLRSVVVQNAAERESLAGALRSMGLQVLPSQTNFLLVHFGAKTSAIEQALFERGVIVRPMVGYGLADYLRITVATHPENQRLLANLKAVLS